MALDENGGELGREECSCRRAVAEGGLEEREAHMVLKGEQGHKSRLGVGVY